MRSRSIVTRSGIFHLMTAGFLVLLVAIFCQPSFGQDQPTQPSKYKDVSWYAVVQIELKPGRRQDFLNVVKKYFEPAGKAEGYEPALVLEHQSGPWDITAIWPMKDGPSSLEWRVTPADASWYKQLVKLAGSADKAKKLREEYLSDIARTTSYITLQENDVFGNTGK